MQEQFPFPSCFSFGAGAAVQDDPSSPAGGRSGQSVAMSMYRTKIAGQCRLITVTWCRTFLITGISVSVEGSTTVGSSDSTSDHDYGADSEDSGGGGVVPNGIAGTLGPGCKVELRPWHFWRRQGSRRFHVEGEPVDVFWDLRAAKFPARGGPEPRSGYYVAVVSSLEREVVLLLGDLKKDAFRRTGCRPSILDAALVSRREHVFGKRRFSTRARFSQLDRGEPHDISVECSGTSTPATSSIAYNLDPEMVIRVDGQLAVHVKHLQWKFRGNAGIPVGKGRVEVYWDVHDWLFGPGLRHALFVFKPVQSTQQSSGTGQIVDGGASAGDEVSGSSALSASSSSEFCLFLYAWKVD